MNDRNSIRFMVKAAFLCVLVLMFIFIAWNMSTTQEYAPSSVILSFQDYSPEVNSSVDEAQQNRDRIKKRFQERKRLLEENCKYVNKPRLPDSLKYLAEMSTYSTNHKLLVCKVAKGGTTTWESHMRKLKSRPVQVSNLKELDGALELADILSSSSTTKVFTARNPISRLISAYNSKFGGGRETTDKTHKLWFDYTEQVFKIDLGTTPNRTISFEIFLKSAISAIRDRHFRPVTENCLPCSLSYDYILHLETFTEDLQYLFNELNITETSVEIRENIAEHVSESKRVEDFFHGVDPALIYKIFDILKFDFLLFGYDLPPFLDEIIQTQAHNVSFHFSEKD